MLFARNTLKRELRGILQACISASTALTPLCGIGLAGQPTTVVLDGTSRMTVALAPDDGLVADDEVGDDGGARRWRSWRPLPMVTLPAMVVPGPT